MTATDPTIEECAAAVHQAYLDTCVRLGWPVKPPNRVPYEQLSEASKELDRASVRATLDALAAADRLTDPQELAREREVTRYHQQQHAEAYREVVRLRAEVAVVRIVAEHWHAAAVDHGWITAGHALGCVLAALDGETDPTCCGVDGADADRITRAHATTEEPQ